MIYDSANDLVLLLRHAGKPEERGIFIYDPTANAWTEAVARISEAWGNKDANLLRPRAQRLFLQCRWGEGSWRLRRQNFSMLRSGSVQCSASFEVA